MKKTLKMENQEGDFYAESFFCLLFIFDCCSCKLLSMGPNFLTC